MYIQYNDERQWFWISQGTPLTLHPWIMIYKVLPDQLTKFGHKESHSFGCSYYLIIFTWPLLCLHMKGMCCHLQHKTIYDHYIMIKEASWFFCFFSIWNFRICEINVFLSHLQISKCNFCKETIKENQYCLKSCHRQWSQIQFYWPRLAEPLNKNLQPPNQN